MESQRHTTNRLKIAMRGTMQQLRTAQYLRRYFEITGRRYSTCVNIKCPNTAAHRSEAATNNARIFENFDGVLIKCYGCGGKWDIFSLWQMDNGGTVAEAKSALCDLFKVGKDYPEPEEQARDGTNTAIRKYIIRCVYAYHDGNDTTGRDYMRKRGISDDTARRFGIGYDTKRKAVVFSYFDKYELRFIHPLKRRNGGLIYGIYEPSGRPLTLYNGEALKLAASTGEPVFIVEEVTDVLSIAEVGGIAVATGGTSGIGKAVDAARRIGRGIYVPCMDRDGSGEKAQAKLTAKLREIGGAVYVYADAPQILLPDATDGTHPKDANEALLIDAAAFRSRVAEVISNAKQHK